jgi:hypothetical protein
MTKKTKKVQKKAEEDSNLDGARWSGPRFFGLRQRPLDSTSTARTGHGQG